MFLSWLEETYLDCLNSSCYNTNLINIKTKNLSIHIDSTNIIFLIEFILCLFVYLIMNIDLNILI